MPLQPNKLQLARKLYREGVEKKDSMLIAEGYYEYGKLYTAASDYLTAKRWFIKALRILETRGDSYELARLYVRLGDMAMTQAHYHESVRNAHHALAIAKRSHSNKALIRSFAILARIHERNWVGESPTNTGWPTSNSDSALYYFRKVEYLAYRLNDPMEVAHVKQDIGNQLLSRKDPRALAYLTTALSIANQQKQADRLPMTLSVASAYLTFDQPDRAWTYIMRAQRLYDEKYTNVYYWQVALEHNYIFFY
ncbi:hypothetical protein [Spirosoma flavum]|uniref:Tetratricopeptide repeat protein n=1 Tax=Spirosoma flavum TaxID=2048557 RepID=A0ABW6APQ6_9BACT